MCKEKAMIFILHPTTAKPANLQKTKKLQRTTHKYVLTGLREFVSTIM